MSMFIQPIITSSIFRSELELLRIGKKQFSEAQ